LENEIKFMGNPHVSWESCIDKTVNSNTKIEK
jgi:hypothetical protein